MKIQHTLASTLLLIATTLTFAADAPEKKPADPRLFEMRIYYANTGKLDALNARFRDHTVKLFEKHGITNIGYWVPVENTDNKLVYIIAFPDRESRDKSFKEFGADPAWREAAKASEKDGRLVAKIESIFLTTTDFSPVLKPVAAGEPRVFELREYKAAEGRLPNLLARFRDHTVKLFEKHGMMNIGYWTPADAKQGADDTLVYIIAHKSQAAAAESFKNFRADPAWTAARTESEAKAGGSLTAPNGVKSTMMTPVDYSPMK